MNIKEIRERRDELHAELGAILQKFEEETGCYIERRGLTYRTIDRFDGERIGWVDFQTFLGENDYDDDADAEDPPEEAKTATAAG